MAQIHWSLTDLPVGETVFTYQVTVPAAPDNFAIWEGNVEESVNILGPTTPALFWTSPVETGYLMASWYFTRSWRGRGMWSMMYPEWVYRWI
jgi:hypothetical protein